jgi:MFS family permease
MPPAIKKSFPVLLLAVFSSLLGSGIIVPLFPLYAESLGATGLGLGILFAGFSLSRAAIMPFAGRLSDRRGRKLILSIGLLGYSLTSFAYIWAYSVPLLTIVRAVQGVAAGMVLPIAQAYVGDISPRGQEGRWMGYFNAAFITGFGVGPLMGGVITEHFGMSYAFSTMGGLNLLACILVSILLKEPERKAMAINTRESLRIMRRSRVVQGTFAFRLAFAVGRGVFAAFLPIYAGITLGLSPSQIGILLAFNILLLSTLQLYGGRIADRADRKVLVIIGGLVNLVSLALVPLTGDFWQVLGICALGGVGGALNMPAISAMMVEEGRKSGMGMAMAALAIAFSIGMAIGPVMAGAIADFVGLAAVFYFGAAVALGGTLAFILLCYRIS